MYKDYHSIILSWKVSIFLKTTLKRSINDQSLTWKSTFRSSHPEVFLEKGALKTCSKFTGEHPCRSVISIKLLCIFIEITRRHGCSPVNLPHIFRTPFLKNTSGRLLLDFDCRTPYTGALSESNYKLMVIIERLVSIILDILTNCIFSGC